MLGLPGVYLVHFYRCNSSKDQIVYDLILVCFFLHNSRVTSTEIYCKHRGQDIYLKYALSNPSAYPRQPATQAVVKTGYSVQTRNRRGKIRYWSGAQRLGLPASTGPTCQFGTLLLIGVLVSSLA